MFNGGSLRYTAKDIRFTTKGAALYAVALGWPEDRRLAVRSLATAAGKVGSVALLGHSGDLPWSQTADGLVVTLPGEKPCEHAYALKILGDHLQPAPLPKNETAIQPGRDGRIGLPASEAEIHGDTPQYEQGGGKDQIGCWADPNDVKNVMLDPVK
ncbi:MAG: alpha-L-fucosidase C-terminal domain-containing protein [Thermoguttaceae bacterium]|jgi:alpha-L-fucosidase